MKSVRAIATITIFLLISQPLLAADGVSRNYLRATGQICQRALMNAFGPPVFLAGFSRKILWSAGPLEGLGRRWGDGSTDSGRVEFMVAKPLKEVETPYGRGSISDLSKDWDHFKISADSVVDVRLDAWLVGFRDVPGIEITSKKVENTSNAYDVEIVVHGDQLTDPAQFKPIVQTLVYRVSNPD